MLLIVAWSEKMFNYGRRVGRSYLYAYLCTYIVYMSVQNYYTYRMTEDKNVVTLRLLITRKKKPVFKLSIIEQYY